MKIIDNLITEKKSDGQLDALSRTLDRLGFSGDQKDAPAQEIMISALRRVLDNRSVLLRNVRIDGTEMPVPLVLASPAGVHVIFASDIKGVYHAQGESWEELDEKTRHFRNATPNLLIRTLSLAQAVGAYLSVHVHRPVAVEPVLFFANPGVHVDSSRPAVRIVLSDAVDRFAAGLAQAMGVLDRARIEEIAQALQGQGPAEADLGPISEIRDVFSFQEPQVEKPSRLAPLMFSGENEPAALKKFAFNKRQWMLLGVLVLVNLILLISLVTIVWLTT